MSSLFIRVSLAMSTLNQPVPLPDIPRLPRRSPDSHKGTFGKVLVVAGSVGMSGAAILAGTAALRGGAGLVEVAVPDPIGPIVAGAQPCYTTSWLPADRQGRLAPAGIPLVLQAAKTAKAVVIGPGLGPCPDGQMMIKSIIRDVACPLVLDADALNFIGSNASILNMRNTPFLVTPHPGEFSRLTARDTRAIQGDRSAQAQAFAKRFKGILVLKGQGTIITDGDRLFVNTTGNPGMATGGSGDVLSGLLGSLLAQGLSQWDAAVLGVYLHGLAGDLARDKYGEIAMIASDILEFFPQVLRAQQQEASSN